MPEDDLTAPELGAPSLLTALIPVVFLALMLAAAFVLYGDEAISGPVQVALILAAMLSALLGMRHGHSVRHIGQGAIDSITTAVGAIFILLAVGALIGTWNMSGTIATLTEYGVQLLDADWFYVAVVLVCAALALAIGSAWTVAGTIGVALIGVSAALGLSEAATAGAVISGAYVGDKLSPLSETTNLAPAVAGTDLYSHIKAMLATTIPSIIITLVVFLIIGLRSDPAGAIETTIVEDILEAAFHTGLVTLIPIVAVVWMAVRKVQPTLTILTGALLGGVVAVIWQQDVVSGFVDDPDLWGPAVMLKGVWSAMATGFVPDTGNAVLDSLVEGGGMASMLETVWLILAALAFGGIMQATGQLARVIRPLWRWAVTDRRLMVATGGTAIAINVLAADQYLAIVLTGSTYREAFEERGIAPQTLSRQVEDTATVTSPLVPWNSCGAYMSASLGVATIAYLPFAIFNWVNPIVSFTYALLGWRIEHADDPASRRAAPEEVEFYGIGGQEVDRVGDV